MNLPETNDSIETRPSVDIQDARQKFESGIAVYVGRRKKLAAMAEKAQTVEEDLTKQISEQRWAANAAAKRCSNITDSDARSKAIQQQTRYQQITDKLTQQLADQQQQTEQINLRLSKVDSALENMRSQQKLLLARLENGGEGVAVPNAKGTVNSNRFANWIAVPIVLIGTVLITLVAVKVAGMLTTNGPARPISVVNSASVGFGLTRTGDRRQEYELADFSVVGSDKLVITLAAEVLNGTKLEAITYADQPLKKVVLVEGKATVGIYFLDAPSQIARSGSIVAKFKGSSPKGVNGVGMFATALAGTASGCSMASIGDFGSPFAAIEVDQKDTYVLVAAMSNDLSTRVPSNSPRSAVSVEAPFVEVAQFNGVGGNEIGSAIAATAALNSDSTGTIEAKFTGLSNRNNRERVVVAAFTPANPL